MNIFISSNSNRSLCLLPYLYPFSWDTAFVMLNVFRTCSESIMFHYPVANQGFISVALIVFGAFVAGARDLSFDARGYAIVFVANITTAVYLATINRIGKSSFFFQHIMFFHVTKSF
jgi:hypothetical protein